MLKKKRKQTNHRERVLEISTIWQYLFSLLLESYALEGHKAHGAKAVFSRTNEIIKKLVFSKAKLHQSMYVAINPLTNLQSEVISVIDIYVRLGHFCLSINNLHSQWMKIYTLNDACKIYEVTIAIVQHMKYAFYSHLLFIKKLVKRIGLL
jgi:hypothetical protein